MLSEKLMSRWPMALLMLACSMVAFWAFAVTAQVISEGDEVEEGEGLTGFRVPEYDAEGNLQSLILGDYVRLLDDGMADITMLHAEQYKDNKVVMWVESPFCTMNEKSKKARSKKEIKIVREKLVVHGRGFSWDSEGQVFKIFNDAKVVLFSLDKQMSEGTAE